jgi:glycogen debranching enzyme
LIDCTHDNETPNQRRTVEDSLPTGALVCMATSAVGSTKGYDLLIPHAVDVVHDTRKYLPQQKNNEQGIS